ncbi:MAG TPA: hypothetical protein VJ476_14020 [Rhizomicrobium sp.]|nr:hypothetical protein [Rhizomicrobium sp.]
MCGLFTNLERIAAQYQVPANGSDSEIASLHDYRDEGIVSINGSEITIAPHWRAATRLVAAAFDSYLQDGQRRHSSAV